MSVWRALAVFGLITLACSSDSGRDSVPDASTGGAGPDGGASGTGNIDGGGTDGPDASEASVPSPFQVTPASLPVPDPSLSPPGPGAQEQVSAALGAGLSLLVWTDQRENPRASFGGDVYAARYTSDGVLLDPNGFRVGAHEIWEHGARAAFGGDVFLVVWWDGSARVRAARVSKAGAVLDPEGIDIAENAAIPDVAFVGDRFIVAFEGNDGNGSWATSVSVSGSVTSAPVHIEPFGFNPRLATDGTRTFMAYLYEPTVTNRQIHALAMDPLGKVIWKTTWSPVLPAVPSLSANASGLAIGWMEQDGVGTKTQLFRLDPASGAKLAPAVVQPWASMTRDGTGYLFADGALGTTQLRRLEDTAAATSAPVSVVTSAKAFGATLSASDGRRLLSWDDSGDAFQLRLDASGAAIDTQPVALPRGTAAQLSPALAGSTPPMLAFCEMSRTSSAVRYLTLTKEGAPAGPVTQIDDACSPSMASAGDIAFLVWHRPGGEGTIEARLLATDGSAGAPLSIAGGYNTPYEIHSVDLPRVVSDGASEFLITHREIVTDDTIPDTLVHARRVSSSGVVGPDVVVGYGYDRSDIVGVAAGKELLVAWTSFIGQGPRVLLARSTAVAGSEPLVVGDNPAMDRAIAAASDGTRVLVVWQDKSSQLLMGALADALATKAGAPFAISGTWPGPLEPVAAFDGQRFLVAWRDVRTRTSDLYMARVTTEGTVLDPGGFPIAAEPGNELAPALLPLGQNQSLMAYGLFDPLTSGVRLRVRSVLTQL